MLLLFYREGILTEQNRQQLSMTQEIDHTFLLTLTGDIDAIETGSNDDMQAAILFCEIPKSW